MTTMYATVLCVDDDCLLVCDCCTREKVIVHTPKAGCFCPGDRVCIRYNGQRTCSIPPQITACHICRYR